MTTFDAREKAFEDKFAHDNAMLFKAEARRNRIVAEWAAKKLGKSADQIDAYVKEVIKSDLEEPGHADVLRKISSDFEDAGVDVPESSIDALLTEKLLVAKEQLLNEG